MEAEKQEVPHHPLSVIWASCVASLGLSGLIYKMRRITFSFLIAGADVVA